MAELVDVSYIAKLKDEIKRLQEENAELKRGHFESYRLALRDYCENCENFVVDVTRIDKTCLGDNSPVIDSTISCAYTNICERLKKHHGF